MTGPLVVGMLAAFVATTVAAGVRRAPRRVSCPVCGSDTESVQLPPALRRAAPELRVRWCATCSWEGLGREGADLTPGRPVAHGSGFRWGRHRLPANFGFRFAEPPTPPPPASDEPPSHPSGFRFASDEAQAPEEGPRPASGRPVAPPAFRWAPSRPRPGFRWAEPGADAPPFRWKDQA